MLVPHSVVCLSSCLSCVTCVLTLLLLYRPRPRPRDVSLQGSSFWKDMVYDWSNVMERCHKLRSYYAQLISHVSTIPRPAARLPNTLAVSQALDYWYSPSARTSLSSI